MSVCALNGLLYACGGYDGIERLSSAECYNPTTNQWQRIRSMNSVRSDAAAAAFNDRIYIAGGFNGDEVLASVEVWARFALGC